MTNGLLCRLQTLMLKDEVCKLTEEERAEFDALWAYVEAEERAKEVNPNERKRIQSNLQRTNV